MGRVESVQAAISQDPAAVPKRLRCRGRVRTVPCDLPIASTWPRGTSSAGIVASPIDHKSGTKFRFARTRPVAASSRTKPTERQIVSLTSIPKSSAPIYISNQLGKMKIECQFMLSVGCRGHIRHGGSPSRNSSGARGVRAFSAARIFRQIPSTQ